MNADRLKSQGLEQPRKAKAQVQVRQGKEPRLAALAARVWQRLPLSEQCLLPTTTAAAPHPETWYCLLLMDQKPVAAAGLTPQGLLQALAVLPQVRGKKLGTRLLAEVIMQARKQSLAALEIQVPRACADFFIRRGFQSQPSRLPTQEGCQWLQKRLQSPAATNPLSSQDEPWVPVSLQSHRHYYFRGADDYFFAKTTIQVPLVSGELPKALGCWPLAFSRQQGRLSLVALLGRTPGRNVFVGDQGQWLGSYIPAALRAHPFQLLRRSGSEREGLLAVDSSSDLLSSASIAGAWPFFDQAGQLSPALQKVMVFLKHLGEQQNFTDRALQALDQAGVLQPWPLILPNTQGQDQPLKGLEQINIARLYRLEPDNLDRLHRLGALPLAYAQIFSQESTQRLTELTQEAHQQTEQVDLEKFFSDQDRFRF